MEVERKKNKPVHKNVTKQQESALDMITPDINGIKSDNARGKKAKNRFSGYFSDYIWSCLKIETITSNSSMNSVVNKILDDYFKDFDYMGEKAKALKILQSKIL